MALGILRAGGCKSMVIVALVGASLWVAPVERVRAGAAGQTPLNSVDGVGSVEATTPAGERSLPFRPPGATPPIIEFGNGTTLPRGAPNPYRTSGVGEFEARCTLSHRAAHDPIVAPGQATFRHLHDFFGNRSTDHLSTNQSLLGQASSCSPATDASAYWVPTLLDDGVAVAPTSAQVYYQVRRPQDPAKVRTMPQGLRIIAGDAQATGPQSDHIVQWRCLGVARPSATIPDCGGGAMQLLIEFPECWDGASLDSADHRSHMRYARGIDCPATHPVLVAQVSFRLLYPVSGPGVVLSSDAMSGHQMPGGTTAHGDWIHAWPQAEFDRRVTDCLHTPRVCDVDGTVVH